MRKSTRPSRPSRPSTSSARSFVEALEGRQLLSGSPLSGGGGGGSAPAVYYGVPVSSTAPGTGAVADNSTSPGNSKTGVHSGGTNSGGGGKVIVPYYGTTLIRP